MVNVWSIGSFARMLMSQLKHELHMKYVGSVGGMYWTLVNPMMQVGMYVFLLSGVLQVNRGAAAQGPLEYALFVLAGMVPWLAFHEGLTSSASSIVRHAGIVKNVVFPLELLPVAAVLASLTSLLVSLAALCVMALSTGKPLGLSIMSLPVLILLQLTLTIGAGMALAVLTTFLRDLSQVLPVLLQLAMLATPVLYAYQDMPSAMRRVTSLNPLYFVVDGYRQVFLYGGWPTWIGLAYAAAVSVLLLIGGLMIFRRTKGYFEAVV
jgi:lipopolysaccharide transport system permease protein